MSSITTERRQLYEYKRKSMAKIHREVDRQGGKKSPETKGHTQIMGAIPMTERSKMAQIDTRKKSTQGS